MRSIEELNDKIWYRLVKVLYLLAIIVVVVSTLFICWSDTSYKPFDPAQFGATPVQQNDVGFVPDASAPNINQLSPSDYTATQQPNGLRRFLGEAIPALLVELLLFELTRRVFYYVALGSWRPRK